MKSIEQICAEYHGLTVEDLRGKSRKEPIPEARQQGMYFYKKFTRLTLSRIAAIFNQDHSTAICNDRLVSGWLEMKKSEQKKNTQEIEVLLLLEGYNIKRNYDNKLYQEISLRELFYECMKELNSGGKNVACVMRIFEERIIKTGIKWTEREK